MSSENGFGLSGVKIRKYKLGAQTICLLSFFYAQLNFTQKLGSPAQNLVTMGYWVIANFYPWLWKCAYLQWKGVEIYDLG